VASLRARQHARRPRRLPRCTQIGACGKSLRVERCENCTIVAAARRLTIANCTDSTFHIAVNTPPLLAGDNRFVQLAPFNTSYQHLPWHLAEAGVARTPVHWSDPMELSRDPYQVRPLVRVIAID
jgi:Tubulin binding cofactor C